MATPQHVDRQTFLTNLSQSGLVTPEQLRAVADRLPDTHRGRLVARALVEVGLLTKFQAEMLLAGRTGGFVLGQYRILDQLGQGGMGRVFKAVHMTMNRVVALKVLAPQLVDTDKAEALFNREMQAAARLHHPNIVTAFDANRVADRYYLVMEFVDGPNLDRLVRDRGPLPIGKACDFIRQAALGLQHAHEMGMVHRDIKPANLLVQRSAGSAAGRRWTIKILDFGLARLHDAEVEPPGSPGTIVTRPHVVMGTPDYVSPEQARDLHAADIRSDLYSLGCTFYFLLTGQVPFPDGTTMEKLVRHSTVEPPPVEHFRTDLPAAVAAIVRRLLAKKPADRYQTPMELAAALMPFAVEGSTSWPGSDPDVLAAAPSAGVLDSGVNLDESAEALDEVAALAGTVADQAPTAPSTSRFGLFGRRPAARRRWQSVLGLVLAFVAGALTLASLVALLASRR
jgi:serine/threonine-protein kinase